MITPRERLGAAVLELEVTVANYIEALGRTEPPFTYYVYPARIKLRLKMIEDIHQDVLTELRNARVEAAKSDTKLGIDGVTQ